MNTYMKKKSFNILMIQFKTINLENPLKSFYISNKIVNSAKQKL